MSSPQKKKQSQRIPTNNQSLQRDFTLKQQQAAAQVEVAKPFPQEEELAQKSARLAKLNAQLDVDEKHHEPEQDEEEKEDAPRRSVLATLEEKKDKIEPVRPFKSYLDKEER